jgi:hypothetical protein
LAFSKPIYGGWLVVVHRSTIRGEDGTLLTGVFLRETLALA